MSIWILSESCSVDESSVDHTVVKDGKAVYLRPKCWSLLTALVEAKKHGRILTYESIGDVLWAEDGGWDDARKASLKEVLDEIRSVIGPGCIKNTYNTGYYLSGDVREECVPQLDRTRYFETLWGNHYKGVIRDQVATGNVRELIDYFVVPTFTAANGKTVLAPFAGEKYSKWIVAGSGFGKTTLLDILLLCSVADELSASGSDAMTPNSRSRIGEYDRIREELAGTASAGIFPVFIHSEVANTRPYSSALELAEAGDAEGFRDMVEEADRIGKLLFLIDSIDEVEADRLDGFLDSVAKLLPRYKNASVVFASRFLGKKTLPFEHEVIHIKELNADAIRKITCSMITENEADRLIERMENNEYLRSLAGNPFMLMTVLETKGDRLVHHMLESIVSAIIDRRWDRHHYDISSEDIKLLLGFLACRFVFDNRTSADLAEIRQCFIKAGDDLKLHGVPYDVPAQDIEYFLKTLSSQSGILNVVNRNHVEKYLFQDSLVMCWLAANYIHRIINESSEIHDREGMGGIWANVHWLDGFLRSVSSREPCLSAAAVNVLVMTLVMSSETSGQDIQKSILYFLICRDATSLDEKEKANILRGYADIVGNAFGENDITNRSDGEAVRLIEQMREARGGTVLH